MKTIRDLVKYHQPKKLPKIQYLDNPVETAWHKGDPSIVVWIASRVGIIPPESMRLFAMWSVIQLDGLIKDYSCRNALGLCKDYYNNPCPEMLKSNMDLTCPSQARSMLEVSGDSEISKRIFEIAEFHHKNWSRLTSLEDVICNAMRSAISTLSEAHCREDGNMAKTGGFRHTVNCSPAIMNTDELSIGISLHGASAADCSAKAIGEAASESFSRLGGDDVDPDMEGARAAKSALAAQAAWLRAHTKPTFTFL